MFLTKVRVCATDGSDIQVALCAWPSFAKQPYITNYRIYDDRVGETQAFTRREDHEWYWFPQQQPVRRH